MKTLKILLLAIAVTFYAGVATAQIAKEAVALCSGDGISCTIADSVVNWGQGTWVEFSIKDDTGCPVNATYKIIARNAGSDIDILITTLSVNGLSSHVFQPLQWYLDWLVIPSDITGCTSLIIVMHPVRPPVPR